MGKKRIGPEAQIIVNAIAAQRNIDIGEARKIWMAMPAKQKLAKLKQLHAMRSDAEPSFADRAIEASIARSMGRRHDDEWLLP